MAISLSTAAIILSFVLLGITIDNNPDWLGWIALDGVFAAIFVTEVVVKGTSLGLRGYFFGRDYWWNWFDVLLSVAAVSETILNLAMATQGSQTKAALILRGLRLARMARLAKLMRMPLLQELTNIISGFVISVRSLFWVMMTLFVVV
ncbi:HERC1, partial [Symbiodinium microadriaticum]